MSSDHEMEPSPPEAEARSGSELWPIVKETFERNGNRFVVPDDGGAWGRVEGALDVAKDQRRDRDAFLGTQSPSRVDPELMEGLPQEVQDQIQGYLPSEVQWRFIRKTKDGAIQVSHPTAVGLRNKLVFKRLESAWRYMIALNTPGSFLLTHLASKPVKNIVILASPWEKWIDYHGYERVFGDHPATVIENVYEVAEALLDATAAQRPTRQLAGLLASHVYFPELASFTVIGLPFNFFYVKNRAEVSKTFTELRRFCLYNAYWVIDDNEPDPPALNIPPPIPTSPSTSFQPATFAKLQFLALCGVDFEDVSEILHHLLSQETNELETLVITGTHTDEDWIIEWFEEVMVNAARRFTPLPKLRSFTLLRDNSLPQIALSQYSLPLLHLYTHRLESIGADARNFRAIIQLLVQLNHNQQNHVGPREIYFLFHDADQLIHILKEMATLVTHEYWNGALRETWARVWSRLRLKLAFRYPFHWYTSTQRLNMMSLLGYTYQKPWHPAIEMTKSHWEWECFCFGAIIDLPQPSWCTIDSHWFQKERERLVQEQAAFHPQPRQPQN